MQRECSSLLVLQVYLILLPFDLIHYIKLCLLQIKGLWKPFVQEVYCGHFSNSICLLLVFVTHFDKSHNISNPLPAETSCKIVWLCRLHDHLFRKYNGIWGFPWLVKSSLVKNLPANSGDTYLIPIRRTSQRRKWQPNSCVLAWEIPWTEEPGGL